MPKSEKRDIPKVISHIVRGSYVSVKLDGRRQHVGCMALHEPRYAFGKWYINVEHEDQLIEEAWWTGRKWEEQGV